MHDVADALILTAQTDAKTDDAVRTAFVNHGGKL